MDVIPQFYMKMKPENETLHVLIGGAVLSRHVLGALLKRNGRHVIVGKHARKSENNITKRNLSRRVLFFRKFTWSQYIFKKILLQIITFAWTVICIIRNVQVGLLSSSPGFFA